jgi:hypothetical protein
VRNITARGAEDDIHVVLVDDGSWIVADGDGRTIRDNFKTNAEAWSWADRFAQDWRRLRRAVEARAAEIVSQVKQ